ncbi:MAG: DUF3277 family protein [Proteobacteria bacterium]|nr:DUF3277 family protein [Pseudomonadota bacterium]
MALYTYSSDQVFITFGPITMNKGRGDGDFGVISQNEDSFTLVVGTDGDATRSKSNNRSGRFSITLMNSDPSNDLLSAMHNVDLNSNGDGINPFAVMDMSGTSVFTCEHAWIVKFPDTTLGREVGSREWVFETDSLINHAGGNAL